MERGTPSTLVGNEDEIDMYSFVKDERKKYSISGLSISINEPTTAQFSEQ